MWNIPLNIMAVIFICATIIKFREDEKNARKALLKKATLEFGNQMNNSKFQQSISGSPANYQKAYKRMKLKN
jgi:hypothetical protein